MIFFKNNKVLGVEPNRVLNNQKEFKKQTRLEASGGIKDVRPCICLYIDSIFTWIVSGPCGLRPVDKHCTMNFYHTKIPL
jgi:hypothetical protein